MKQDKKKQMKQKNNPAQILKDKKDKLDYLLPNDSDYINLLSNTTLIEINIEENEYKEKIKAELELLNLINTLAIKFSNRQILESNN